MDQPDRPSAPGSELSLPAIEVRDVAKRYTRDQRESQRSGVRAILEEIGSPREPSMALQGSQFWAVSGVSFEVHPGHALGIVGRNGAGKSTMLRMIAGITKPTSGEVVVRGRPAVLLDPNAGFDPVLTGWENAEVAFALVAGRRPSREVLEQIGEYGGLTDVMDAPVRTYSQGMKLRLGFSTMVHSDPDVMVIDEALAVGDTSFQLQCLEQLHSFRQGGGAVVFVSHSLWLFQHLASEGIHLSNGTISLRGGPAEVADHYVAELQSGSWVDAMGGPEVLDRERPAAAAEASSDEGADEEAEVEASALSQRPVRIRGVRVVAEEADGGEPPAAVSGSPVDLDFDLVARAPVEAAELAVTIWTADLAVCVAGDLSSDEGSGLETGTFPIPAGRSVLRYRIERCLLAAGRYAVRVAVYDAPTSDVIGLHGYEDNPSWLQVLPDPDGPADPGVSFTQVPRLRSLRLIDVEVDVTTGADQG